MKILIKESCEVSDEYCNDRCALPAFIKSSVISVSGNENTVDIWEPNSVYCRRTSLVGHDKKISAFAVSPKSQNFVCTCSDDKIILWKVDIEYEGKTRKNGKTTQGLTFATDPGSVDYCTFSSNDDWLAICRENEILIINIKFNKGNVTPEFDVTHHTSLETNSTNGNLCAFSPLNNEVLIATEDSCYFKVWNFISTTLLYKSAKLGMYTITHCSFATAPPYLLLGTNGPVVHVFNNKEGDIPRYLTNINIGKAFSTKDDKSTKIDTVSDYSLRKKYSNESTESSGSSGEVGCIVFGIYLFKREMRSLNNCLENEETKRSDVANFLNVNHEILRTILCPSSVIVICCNLGIALFNGNSWECETVLKMTDMLPEKNLSPKMLPLLSFLVLGGDSLDNFTCMLKMSLNDNSIHLLKLGIIDELHNVEEASTSERNEPTISVVPLVPVKKTSPLRYQISSIPNVQDSPYKLNGVKKRSSGYGKPSNTKMFFPVINKSTDRNQMQNLKMANKKKLHTSKSVLNMTIDQSSYINSAPPTKAGPKFCVWNTTGTQVQLSVTGDGETLACSSSSSYMSVVKFNDMNPEKGLNLVGHDGAITSLHFSFNSQWLVSSSTDEFVKVWDWRRKKCILNIDRSFQSQKVANSKCKKESIKNSISQARFYYMDKFLLTACQDKLVLFAHSLHEIDGEPLQSENLTKTKSVCNINVPAQQITCFSSANKFYSYIILCCCSNHSLQVYDMNVQKFVTELHNIHPRPAHHIKQMEGSHGLAHPSGMYNLFLTSSVCDSSKLWDLRSARCVQKYNQHMNRAYSCGIDVSPCGCYIAAGSEDRYVYLYDTRRCVDYFEKLGGLGEVVTDVIFNPQKPVLAAAALNGCIISYSS